MNPYLLEMNMATTTRVLQLANRKFKTMSAACDLARMNGWVIQNRSFNNNHYTVDFVALKPKSVLLRAVS